MIEYFDLPDGFPTKEELEQETISAINFYGGVATTRQIKKYIIDKLKLSHEVQYFENSDGLTTLLDYRMRWARTSLRIKGLITNYIRGSWKVEQ